MRILHFTFNIYLWIFSSHIIRLFSGKSNIVNTTFSSKIQKWKINGTTDWKLLHKNLLFLNYYGVIHLVRRQNFSEKLTFFTYPLIRTRTCACQGVRDVSFSENYAYLLTTTLTTVTTHYFKKILSYCKIYYANKDCLFMVLM